MSLGCCCNIPISIQAVRAYSEDDTACGPLGPDDFDYPTAVDGECWVNYVNQYSNPDTETDTRTLYYLRFNKPAKTFSGYGFAGVWGFAAQSIGWMYDDGHATFGMQCDHARFKVNGPADATAGVLLYYDVGTWDISGDLPTPDSYAAITSGDIYTPDPGGFIRYSPFSDPPYTTEVVFIVGRDYGDLSFPLDRDLIAALWTFT